MFDRYRLIYLKHLAIACLLMASFGCAFATDTVKSKIYIMLDVDNTITDRADASMKDALISKGYKLQTIHFTIDKGSNFYKYYKNRLIKHNKSFDPNSDSLAIEELIAIRPTMSAMLQSIIDFGKSSNIPVHILICSRKDITRTTALINSLDLHINGKFIRELSDVVPRENFRVATKSNGVKTVYKSAKLLRSTYNGKYGTISPNDFVFLIDQLPDDQFITSDAKHDLNLMIPAFEVKTLEQGFNIKSDQSALEASVKKIKDFVSSSKVAN